MTKGKNCNEMDLKMGVAGTLQSLVNGLYNRQSQTSFYPTWKFHFFIQYIIKL